MTGKRSDEYGNGRCVIGHWGDATDTMVGTPVYKREEPCGTGAIWSPPAFRDAHAARRWLIAPKLSLVWSLSFIRGLISPISLMKGSLISLEKGPL